MSVCSKSVPIRPGQSSVSVGPLVGVSEKRRTMLEFYNHDEPFRPTLEIWSHPSAGGTTERPCSRKPTGKSERSEKCQEYHLSSRNSSALLWCSCESAGGISPRCGLWPQISRPVAMSQPQFARVWGKPCYRPRQPREAGSFQYAALTLPSRVRTPWVLG